MTIAQLQLAASLWERSRRSRLRKLATAIAPLDKWVSQSYQKLLERLRDEPERLNLPTESDVDRYLDGDWLQVQSSNVSAIRYLPDDGALEVEYLNHGMYRYENVSLMEAQSFAEALSAGKWVWDHLRVRGRGNKYAFQKPYSFISGPSDYEPKWMQSRASRRAHGAIGPSGQPEEG